MSFCHSCLIVLLIYVLQCSFCSNLVVGVRKLVKWTERTHSSQWVLESDLPVSRHIIVDSIGSGDFKTVQSAVDAVPINNLQWIYIQINAGLYREKVMIPYNKPYIIFQGAGRKNTVIVWGEAADADGSTADSATFSSFAPNFIAEGIGFKNSAPPAPPGVNGKQAVAALVAGDMAAFYDCGFYGAQDTLFDYQGRHYFKNCYIEGSIDFIFGHGQSIYKECDLYAIAQGGNIPGAVTAQNRATNQEISGFIFIACTISGSGKVFLGRAWGPYSRVIYAYTYMEDIIIPQGWDDWGLVERHRSVEYGQYKCYGVGANTTDRVKWSQELTDQEVQPFLDLRFIDGIEWLHEF